MRKTNKISTFLAISCVILCSEIKICILVSGALLSGFKSRHLTKTTWYLLRILGKDQTSHSSPPVNIMKNKCFVFSSVSIRIRIQQFSSMRIRIQIQGFDDKKQQKNLQLNKIYSFYYKKIAIYLSLGRSSYRRSLQALKREHPAQNMNFVTFFYFCRSFLPSWIRIRIRKADHDPAEQNQMRNHAAPNPKHCGKPIR